MSQVAIQGSVYPGFDAVRDAFAENFARRNELGAACCIYQNGEKVVDLWGGTRNSATGEAWEEDTMVLVYSATKGLAAMTLAVAHSRGWLDYEERVSTYWPEFAQQAKDKMFRRTVGFGYLVTAPRGVLRQLLNQAEIRTTRKKSGQVLLKCSEFPEVFREMAGAPIFFTAEYSCSIRD